MFLICAGLGRNLVCNIKKSRAVLGHLDAPTASHLPQNKDHRRILIKLAVHFRFLYQSEMSVTSWSTVSLVG